jgi:hypothetical protein
MRRPPREDGVCDAKDAGAEAAEERDPRRSDRSEDELIMHLERDQLVAETSRPVPRAALGPRATAAAWALRVFVVVVSAMVIYTFIQQLH